MKAIIIFCTIFLLSSFAETKQQRSFQQLHALTGGTWVMKTKKGFICERWKKVDGHTLRNESFKVAGSDTTILEQVDLVEKENGINYVSTVKDQNGSNPVPFKLIGSKDGQFIFANPEHDFPQRIIYHFVSQDSLHAWIDGKYNGIETRSDFYYKRVF